ncbi:MAG: zinc-finger domain-containing protein [Alphaproteobacteria bacterium]|nr:zinc-finger domain-containing protein [Alphaproteobacteria bacterium SS10]
MSEPVETIYVDTVHVSCDGGGGALGHPIEYMTIAKVGWKDCPYCGRRFILKEDAKADH